MRIGLDSEDKHSANFSRSVDRAELALLLLLFLCCYSVLNVLVSSRMFLVLTFFSHGRCFERFKVETTGQACGVLAFKVSPFFYGRLSVLRCA